MGGDIIIQRILDLLISSGITAKQLTSELELSNSAITDWKKGKAKPSTDAIIKLATYFNVSTDYLLTGTKNSEIILSIKDKEWIELIHQLPIEKQYEFKGELKGYLKRMEETSVAAEEAPAKSGKSSA